MVVELLSPFRILAPRAERTTMHAANLRKYITPPSEHVTAAKRLNFLEVYATVCRKDYRFLSTVAGL